MSWKALLLLLLLTQAGVKLISLPSKRLGLFTAAASTIIARSDSNGEDLEAFAGAGMSYHIAAYTRIMLFIVVVHLSYSVGFWG